MKCIGLILAALVGLAVQAVPASAAIQYTLNCSSAAANCGAGNNNFNFGTVTLSDNGGGSIDVTVVLAANHRFANGQNTVDFLWNTTLLDVPVGNSSETVSNLSNQFNSNTTMSNGTFTAGAAGNYINTGGANFDFRITRANNGNTSLNTLSFDVTRVGGLTIGNFNEFNNDGAGSFFFAAQIFNTATSTALWVASNKAGVDIPEPATWLLFFSVLAGLTLLYHRRKLARA